MIMAVWCWAPDYFPIVISRGWNIYTKWDLGDIGPYSQITSDLAVTYDAYTPSWTQSWLHIERWTHIKRKIFKVKVFSLCFTIIQILNLFLIHRIYVKLWKMSGIYEKYFFSATNCFYEFYLTKHCLHKLSCS